MNDNKKEFNLADCITDPPPPTKKRGGPQPGSGPKPKDPKDKVVKCYISMTRAHHEATEGNRAGMIRRALDLYLKAKYVVTEVRTMQSVGGVFEYELWGHKAGGSELVYLGGDEAKYQSAYAARMSGIAHALEYPSTYRLELNPETHPMS